MPSHTHCSWWDLHHDDNHWRWGWDATTWPWSRDCSHFSCALRRTRRWRNCWPLGGASDYNVCTRDNYAPHWHSHWKSDALSSSSSPSSPPLWCHRSCLTGAVVIETGDEPNSMGKGTFKVMLDVHHFRPDELVLKVRNQDTILLQGKQQEERASKALACITREFTRRYKLPRHYDATQANATLSTDGILTIVVPAPPPLDDVERLVEIQQTGVYFGSETKALEGATEEQEKKQQEQDTVQEVPVKPEEQPAKL